MVLRKSIYKGVYFQRGHGIGSILSGLFRLLVPFVKRGASAAIKSPHLKKVLQSAKKSALTAAGSVASDIIKGKSPKKSAKVSIQKAQVDIEKAVNRAIAKQAAAKGKAKKRKAIASSAPTFAPGGKKVKPLL